VKKAEAGFSRLFLIIVGSIVLVLVVCYSWGFQTMIWWKFSRDFSKKMPIVNLTPQSLPNVAANSSEGMKLSHVGFEFEVPWADLDKEKSKVVRNLAVFAFRSGRVIMFYGPSPTHEDLLSEIEKEMGDKDHNKLRQLFGPEATRTNYAFHKTLLEETPARLSPWMSRREALRSSFLLTFKIVSSVGGETGLFNVAAHDWEGFQFDDPAKQPTRVTLELYDSQDRHVEIIFLWKKNEGVDVTQADLNRVLQTLKPGDPLFAAETIKPADSKIHN
jgi:hypothetical protein